MRERVAALGSRLLLENRPGGGARVVADLPRPDDPGRRAARASVRDAETVPITQETEPWHRDT